MRLRSLFSCVLGIGAWMSWPSTTTLPDLISSSRLTVRISVDLPEPDGPQTTTTSPFLTSALMSFSAWYWPYHLLTFENKIISQLLGSGFGRQRLHHDGRRLAGPGGGQAGAAGGGAPLRRRR